MAKVFPSLTCMRNLPFLGSYYGFPGDGESLIHLFNTRIRQKNHSVKLHEQLHDWEHQRKHYRDSNFSSSHTERKQKLDSLPTMYTEVRIFLTIYLCRAFNSYRRSIMVVLFCQLLSNYGTYQGVLFFTTVGKKMGEVGEVTDCGLQLLPGLIRSVEYQQTTPKLAVRSSSWH